MTFVRAFWAPVVGAGAIIAGVFIAWNAPPESFGWSAYAPLSYTAFTPPFMTGQFWIGAALAGVGLALLAGWVGYRIGRKRLT